MNKAEFLSSLQAERLEWDRLLVEAGEDRMEQPGVEGEWSLKDIVAHVAWYEREMVELIGARRLAGSELWQLPTHQRNEAIYQANRGRPLAEVLAEGREVYSQFLQGFASLKDEDLVDPARFADMPEDWLPGQVMAGNSYEHYREHLPAIRAWLAKQT